MAGAQGGNEQWSSGTVIYTVWVWVFCGGCGDWWSVVGMFGSWWLMACVLTVDLVCSDTLIQAWHGWPPASLYIGFLLPCA